MSGLTEPCVRCGEPVDMTNRKVVVEMVGFAPRARTAGGVNRLFFRRETGRALCDGCFNGGGAASDEAQGRLV